MGWRRKRRLCCGWCTDFAQRTGGAREREWEKEREREREREGILGRIVHNGGLRTD